MVIHGHQLKLRRVAGRDRAWAACLARPDAGGAIKKAARGELFSVSRSAVKLNVRAYVAHARQYALQLRGG